MLTYIWIGLNDVAAVLAVAIAKTPTRGGDDPRGRAGVRPAARRSGRGLPVAAAAAPARGSRCRSWRPIIAAAGRSGLSITWKIVLIVELLGRPNGVGFELNLQFQNFDVAGILAYGLSFAAIMLVVEATLLQPWERRANAWRRRA